MQHRVFTEGPETLLGPYYERMVEPRVLRAGSKAEWQDRRRVLRPLVQRALALDPYPERLPLEVHTGGALPRAGYRVERVYWQTWPEVWASGWLYVPEGIAGRTPAVLNPHGHWQDGARHPTVQSRCIGLARLGYVALAVDSVHLYDYPTGLTPLSVMTWNNIRALDYLASRPDVDRDRLGVTGASGGAQQAMYLCALDDRPRAAVLAVLVSYFRRILMPDRHHCPCNHVPDLMRFTDEPELCAIFSPRAALVLTVTGDWTAEFPQHELRELRAIYRLWGQDDRLAHRQFPGPHDYPREMRELAYGWFARELRGDRTAPYSIPEPEHVPEPPATLSSLDAAPPGDRGTDGILEWYRRRYIVQPPALEGRPSRKAYNEELRAGLRDLLGEAVPATLDTRRHGVTELGAIAAFQVSFRSEPEVRLPALWIPPAESPGPVIVLLHPLGKGMTLKTPHIAALHSAGWGILAPDVRLCGELHREWLHNGIVWGRPEAGMAVDDVRACVDWLCGDEDVDPRRIVLLGEGHLGVVALLAAGLDERVRATIADCCSTTYRDGGAGLPVIPNLLRVADLPQIAGLSAPRALWLYHAPPDRVGFSSRRYYDWVRRTYQSLGDADSLVLSTGEKPEPGELLGWLEARRVGRG